MLSPLAMGLSTLILILAFSFSPQALGSSTCKAIFPDPHWSGYIPIFRDLRAAVRLAPDEYDRFLKWHRINRNVALKTLEKRLEYHRSLKDMLNAVPHLREVLLLRMYLSTQYGLRHHPSVLQVLGEHLDDGFFLRSSAPTLEFLFLISEQPTHPIVEHTAKDEALIAKDFFHLYAMPEIEVWNRSAYETYRNQNELIEPKRVRRIEGHILRWLAESRARFRLSSQEFPPDLVLDLEQVNAFFQRGYHKIFHIPAPTRLHDFVRLTDHLDSIHSADAIRQKLYIDAESAADINWLLAFCVHGVLQLGFQGFHALPLKEGFLELLREEMHNRNHPTALRFIPLSAQHDLYRRGLRSILPFVPYMKETLFSFYLTQHPVKLRRFLKANLTPAMQFHIRLSNHRNKGTELMLSHLKRFANE